MNNDNPNHLAPIPNMNPGVAVGTSTATKDPDSGQITKSNYMAQCAIPTEVLILTAIDSMQDKDAQGKMIALIEANHQQALEENIKSNARQEERNDKKAAAEISSKFSLLWFAYGFTFIFVAGCVILSVLKYIGILQLIVLLIFILLFSITLISTATNNKGHQTKQSNAQVSVSNSTEQRR